MPTNYRRLCHEDRSIIQALRKEGFKQSVIADVIGVNQSTISRELMRNTGCRGYRPRQAQLLAEQRKCRQRRPRKLQGSIAQEVEARLRLLHSPEQISGAMAREGFDAASHELIYQYIAQDKTAGGTLYTCLRINGKRRYRRRVKGSRSKIPGRVDIAQRPASVESRRYFGDWEADLIEGRKGTGFILTLVERKSRLTIFEKLPDKQAPTVTESIVRRLCPLRVRTLTFDNGMEFAGHIEVTRSLGAKGYFCTPYHSWEKGLVENHNGLFRQYYPKGSSFEGIDQTSLDRIEIQLNERPRKVLDFKCPMDYLNKIIAA